MEALLIIFAEIIFACLAPLFSLIGAALFVFFEGFLLLLAAIFGASWGPKERKTKNDPRRKPLISRKALHWTAGLVGGLGVLGVLGSVVFFDPLLRTVLTRAGAHADITIDYDDSSGSLLFGRVALTNLEMSRQSDSGLAFDLKVDAVEADVDLFSLLGNEPRIELATVEGLSGAITPPVPSDTREARVPKTRRPFRADRVAVEEVDLQITPRNSDPYRLEIAQGEVAPLRSKTALFDLLFRSNLEAQVAGQSLVVETKAISSNGRETRWDFDEVEVDRLRVILPRAPLTWLSDGTVTVQVEDRWDLDDEEIDMDWRIALEGIDVVAPEEAGRAERLLANGLARAVDRQDGSAEFQYELELDQEEVAALRSGDLSAFWDVVLSGFVDRRLASFTTRDPEKGEQATDEGRFRRTFNALKDRLKRDEDSE